MRQERVSVHTLIMAVLLAVLISFSCVMCLNDAFVLEAPMVPLLAVCCGAAVLAALSCVPKRSWPLGLLAAVVLVGVVLWKRDTFFDSLETVVYAVTVQYAMAFDNIRVVGTPVGDPIWVLLVLAVPIAWLTACVCGREGSAVLVLLSALPVLVLVLLVVNLAPILWLILLTGGLLLVVMSHSVRERNHVEGSVLAWWLIAPTIILFCVVTVLWPPADYVRTDWSESLRDLAQSRTVVEKRVEAWKEITVSKPRWSRELKTVDLKRLGPKAMTGLPVLRYKTDGAISYLRGVSLAVYENNAWSALPAGVYESYGLPDEPLLNSVVMTNVLELEIQTREPQLYTTYYLADIPAHGAAVEDAYVQNPQRLTRYQIGFDAYLQYPAVVSGEADRLALEIYTQVPEAMKEPLTGILAENGLTAASAQEIADYVRSCAVYDLDTPEIPAGEDFVLYFLTDSQRGYCVHFASAAVMLLRTAGIPARYVTGYAVDGALNQWNQVTEDDAHAWVEYYTVGTGWRPLDPTPADTPVPPPVVTEPEDTELPAPEREEPTSADPVPIPAPDQAEPLPKGSVWLLALPGFLLLVALRRFFGLQYRRGRCRKGHPNRRTMTYWRWLVQLRKAAGTELEEELLCLAEKARFSQHTMEESEIAVLRQAVETQIQTMKTATAARRLWWKYGLVLF